MNGIRQDTTLLVAILTAVVCSIAAAIYTWAEVEPAPVMSLILTLAPMITVILWLQKDAQRTGVGAVHDLGLLVWLTWPLVLPWYAFKSRGRQGWRLLLGLMVLLGSTYVAAFASAWLAYVVSDTPTTQ